MLVIFTDTLTLHMYMQCNLISEMVRYDSGGMLVFTCACTCVCWCRCWMIRETLQSTFSMLSPGSGVFVVIERRPL